MSAHGSARMDETAPSALRWGVEGVSTPEQALDLPVGTVTFVVTDIAGSTRMWEHEQADAMQAAIVRHYEILAAAVDAHHGVRPQEQGEGDSIVAAFARPTDALAAALQAQHALQAEPWNTREPVRVRMAIHTGEARLRDASNYAGQAIIRAARLRGIGHGGQILVSGTTRDLVVDQTGAAFDMQSLGEHRLRDLGRPEHVWQLVHPDLPSAFDRLASLDAHPNTLPISLSPFVGREAEIATISGLVRSERLVTVTGTGGAGKTRLAQQVGAELVSDFPVGVWWVELAPLCTDGVESAVRSAFGVSEGDQVALEEMIRRRLKGEPCLLIVDNCEHVSEVVGPLLHRILSHVPTLHVLATSRVMLGLPGEVAWRVPPLGLPEGRSALTVERLGEFDSVQLFCDRARRARPNFELTADNASAVVDVCRRVNGIPLAIELAAARCRSLDLSRILAGLDDALRLLSAGSRTVLPRQQTLEASIAWSYDLLSPSERTLLRRLSVFVDGWTLDTAEAICADPRTRSERDALDPAGVFDALDRLVDHSLVHTDDSAPDGRFGMLETVRQFASRRLASVDDDHGATADRHSAHFTDWVISLRTPLMTAALTSVYPGLTAERGNVLAAVAHEGDHGRWAQACGALTALAPVFEMDDWGPHSKQIAVQVDRLEPVVSPADLWKVMLVRQKVLALRGDPRGELETLEAMRRAAEAADESLGVGISRIYTAAIVGIAGLPVLDEFAEATDLLEDRDRHWAAIGRTYLAFFAAYHGRLNLVDEVMAEIESRRAVHDGPIHRVAENCTAGICSLLRGDALLAVDPLRAVLHSPFAYPSIRANAAGFLVFAGADLGQDLVDEVEPALRARFEIDGNAVAGMIADGTLAVRALLRADEVHADELLRRSLDGALALGVAIGWPHERYTLVAAGFDGYEIHLDTESTPGVNAANHRARAEQALQRGEHTEALDQAHKALAIEVAESLRRGILFTLECLARVLTAAGRATEATRILGSCASFRSARSLVLVPCLQRLIDESASALRAAMGAAAFDAAYAEGEALTLEAAADYSSRLRVGRTTTTTGWDALTPTEALVAELVSEGLTNPQVATELLMGSETVKTHLSRVFAKVGVANRKELILLASRRAAERHR